MLLKSVNSQKRLDEKAAFKVQYERSGNEKTLTDELDFGFPFP
jgi:hypothetical protein